MSPCLQLCEQGALVSCRLQSSLQGCALLGSLVLPPGLLPTCSPHKPPCMPATSQPVRAMHMNLALPLSQLRRAAFAPCWCPRGLADHS
jgi:hypothetical protein